MTDIDNNYDNPLAKVETPKLDEDLEKFLSELNWKDEDIEGSIFDPTEPDIPVCYSMEYNGTPFAPLGGLVGLNGRPGHGKTMTFSMIISCVLSGEYGGLKCTAGANASVLYIDTEMEKSNTQRVVRRIYKMAGIEQRTRCERFNAICLREEPDADSRWRKILKAIWMFKPTFVFLDGMIDVVRDFNDNKECQERIYQIMKVASHYNISMWCLLHLNPGSEKAVGHMGSFLERKSADIFVTKYNEELNNFNVSHIKHRLIKIGELVYKVEDDCMHYGTPILSGMTQDNEECKLSPEEQKRDELYGKVKDAMKSLTWSVGGNNYTSIENGLKRLGITSHRMLSDYITLSQQIGIVIKKGNKYYIVYDDVKMDNQKSMDLIDDPNESEPF